MTEVPLPGTEVPYVEPEPEAPVKGTTLYVRNQAGQFAVPYSGLPMFPTDSDLEFLAVYLRDRGYVVTKADPNAGDDRATFRVSPDHPDTSRAIVTKIRAGSLQDRMLGLFERGQRYSDDGLEQILGRSHQSVSATRNTLVRKGYLVNSGETEVNRWGNDAILWMHTGKERP